VADLRRFWIRLSDDRVNPSRRGYGVTAFDESDALAILRYLVFQDDAETMPEVVVLVQPFLDFWKILCCSDFIWLSKLPKAS